MNKAAIYARVSTEEQTEGFSLDAQLEAMRDYSQSKDYEVVGEYVDGGFSGRSDNRPQFKKLIADAQAGLFNTVIVHKFDRFARSRDHSVTYKALLRKIDVPVLSVMEPTDPDSPTSIITEGMLEVLGEWFSANLGQEIRKGKRKAAQLGRWQGGWLKYGYTVEDGFFDNEEKEAKHLLTMFQKVDKGMPLRQLAKWLYEQGIPAKRGGQWTAQHLSNLLRDRTYIGEGKYGKLTRKGDRFVKSSNAVSVPYPAIIPKDLFDRVQVRLTENKRKNNGSTKVGHFYILSHLGKCGECGGSLLCQTARGHRYLYCQRQLSYPCIHNCYEPKRWHMDTVEDYVWAEVEDILHNYRNSAYDLLLDKFESAKGEREQQIVRAKEQLEGMKLEKQRLLTTIRKGYATEVEAELQFIAIKSEREYWEQELNNLQFLQDNDNVALNAFMAQLKQLDGWFDYGFYPSPEQKKELLNVLLKEFVLYRDGRIELRFKLPVNEKQVADTVLTLSQNKLLLY